MNATCPECGTSFVSQPSGHSLTGRTIYCSKSCAAKASNRKRTYQRAGDDSRSRASRKAATRRRRLRHAVTWDGVTDEQILERDRWMCWICKRKIGKTFTWPHPRSASIDHEMPLALGGDDTQFNKRAAHLGCNMARGAGKPGEQLTVDFANALPPRGKKPQGKPCKTCGEIPGSNCTLHMPVRYLNCPVCGHLFVQARGSVYCSADCTRSGLIARAQVRPGHLRGLEAKVMQDAGMSLSAIAGKLGYSGPQYAAAAIARATGKRSVRRTEPYVRQPRVGIR